MKPADKTNALKKLAERLYDPLQFRVFVTLVILAIGYVGVHSLLSDRIAKTTQGIKQTKDHQTLVKQIDQLETEIHRIASRLPKDTDTNEWVQYVFGGIRNLPVKLTNLDSDEPRPVGPFDAVVLTVELQGDYHGLESFLNWIETNERLFRIDSVAVAPARGNDMLEMKVTLLGLRG